MTLVCRQTAEIGQLAYIADLLHLMYASRSCHAASQPSRQRPPLRQARLTFIDTDAEGRQAAPAAIATP